ncbi:MAG: DNA-processing protein DprA [Chloroflexota bacterium]|nr:DNA-processing protein DprA [Chloroflexota bacterium]
MISAGFAAEQGREVMAVPGPVTSPNSEGVHYLLRQGAKLVTGVEDVLEELSLQQVAVMQEARAVVPADPTEAVLLGCLSTEPLHVDDLAREAGLPIALVSGTLTLMELKGMARSVGAMQYVLAR